MRLWKIYLTIRLCANRKDASFRLYRLAPCGNAEDKRPLFAYFPIYGLPIQFSTFHAAQR